MVEAVLGVELPIDGTEDVTCELTGNGRNGVQILSKGFAISDVTVTITSILDQDTEVAIDNGANHVLIAERFAALKRVTLSGFTPGSYTVLFIR